MSDFGNKKLITSQNFSLQYSPQKLRTQTSHVKRRQNPQKASIFIKPTTSSSMNIKDFMQVQRKKLRGMMIMKSFEKSNTELNLLTENSHPGFKGKKVISKKISSNTKNFQELEINERIGLAPDITPNFYQVRSPQKPNIMVNLTLYRKSFRERNTPNSQQLKRSLQKGKKFKDIISPFKRSKTEENRE